MEVNAGYKQTDVGVVPGDWDLKRLGDIAAVTAGGTPSRTNAKYWNGDIPWITTSEVDFCTIQRAEQFITKEGLNNSAAKLLPPGTLLMALYGQGKTRGKIAILEIEAATNQACAAISLKSSVSREFVFHFLASKYDAIRNLSNTGNQENLNSSLVRSISILLPPEAEQRAIATALSDVDALLDGLTRLIAKKRDLKQATMQQLLTGQTRLPGFNSEWRDTTLGEIITRFSTGLNPRQNFQLNAGGTLFYVTIKNFSGGHLFLDEQCDLIDEEAFNIINQRADLQKDDILFASIGRVGDAYLIVETPTTWNINESVFTLRPDKDKVVPLMLFYLLTNNSVKDALGQGVTGSTFKSIKQADLKRIPCRLPISKDEQTSIATILSDMDAELAALEARLTKTRSLKQAMMQELLTGKTRLLTPEATHA